MTKRLKTKHKVDRRLKATGRPNPFNARAYPQVNMDKTKNQLILVFNYKQNKNQNYYGNINEDNFVIFTEKLYLKEIRQKI